MDDAQIAMDEDIGRVAASAAGQAFRAINMERRNRRAAAAHERFNARVAAECARHVARIKAITAQRDAALEAARSASHEAEHTFFKKQLGEQPSR